MAPWPRLMTPIRPKITARPEAASASTRVMRTASATTLRIEASKLSPGGGWAAPRGTAPLSQSGSDLQAAGLGCTEGSAWICSNMSVTLVQPGRTRIR